MPSPQCLGLCSTPDLSNEWICTRCTRRMVSWRSSGEISQRWCAYVVPAHWLWTHLFVDEVSIKPTLNLNLNLRNFKLCLVQSLCLCICIIWSMSWVLRVFLNNSTLICKITMQCTFDAIVSVLKCFSVKARKNTTSFYFWERINKIDMLSTLWRRQNYRGGKGNTILAE